MTALQYIVDGIALGAVYALVAVGLALVRICRVAPKVDCGSVDAGAVMLPVDVLPFERAWLVAGKVDIRQPGSLMRKRTSRAANGLDSSLRSE